MVEVCTRGVRYRFRGAGLCQSRGPRRRARHYRVATDFLHRAYAPGACRARLAGPRFGILCSHAACGPGCCRELFLERREGIGGEFTSDEWRLRVARRMSFTIRSDEDLGCTDFCLISTP